MSVQQSGTQGTEGTGGGGGGGVSQPYQCVDASQGVVGVVQGVEQLVHPIVGLAVPIEADTDSRAGGREGTRVREGGNAHPKAALGHGDGDGAAMGTCSDLVTTAWGHPGTAQQWGCALIW